MKAYTDKHAKAGLNAKLPKIETFPSQFSGYEVIFEVPEYTSVCPKTGLSDFAKITVRYLPAKTCIELKSFKMYILAYRNLGIFCENAVNRILKDLVAACKPKWMSVKGEFNPRGGIATIVEAVFPRKS